MNTLARYLEVIVDPTWDDFDGNRKSPRLAFLACVATNRERVERARRRAFSRRLANRVSLAAVDFA